ncbi:hypothetical protein ACFYKT_06350 [Cytobacillus sp. FJAT-53684]|uniref:Helicase/UvrB N-terminal domain-containing protein n=1 Tax=Cytobacillus mangrovibacter TaxID=3299024 RepID=A0ABW6JVR6_9BACI
MLYKHATQMKINIIDSIMGSGKTSWAIQHMKNAPAYQKFIYITPFTNEVERVITSVNRDFKQPQADFKGETKLEDIKRLIGNGENIVSTHSLFQRVDSEIIDLLEMENYTLILDEVMNVVEQMDEFSKDDLKMLYTKDVIEVDEKGFVHWKQADYKEGFFEKIRNLANSGNLMMYEDESREPVAVYWTFPAETFQCFDDIYILTYMFDGQIQRAYFDLFGRHYIYKSIEKEGNEYKLADYISYSSEKRSQIRELVNIYYPRITDKKNMNKIGSKTTSFSVSDLKNKTKATETKRVLKNCAYNFYRHKCKVPTDEVMWTTFKQFKTQLTPTGLKEQFVSVNARATNEFQHKSTLIYFANIYTNPVTKNFFSRQGVEVNMDLFALSELLQWIFRSRIRTGKPINVYIPSMRMRTLLEKYLNNEM